MENKIRNKNKNKRKVVGSTTSSNIAVELFGPKDSSSSFASSSAGLFASLFPHPSTGRGGVNSSGITGSWKHQDLGNGSYQRPDDFSHGEKKEDSSSIYENAASESSSYFSSSIYYGGREAYSPRTQSTHSHPPYIRDGGEDVADDKVSRGDWWQGSYYY